VASLIKNGKILPFANGAISPGSTACVQFNVSTAFSPQLSLPTVKLSKACIITF